MSQILQIIQKGFYDISPIEKVERSVNPDTSSTDNSIASSAEETNLRFSISYEEKATLNVEGVDVTDGDSAIKYSDLPVFGKTGSGKQGIRLGIGGYQ